MMNFKAQVPRSIMDGVPANYMSSTLIDFGDASLEVYAAEDAKQITNSRPLGLSSEYPESLPLTPNHLLL